MEHNDQNNWCLLCNISVRVLNLAKILKAMRNKAKESASNKQIERANYPTESLESCLELIDTVVESKGTKEIVDRKEIAVIVGKAPSTLILKISACVQYGLVTNHYGKGYQPSELYQRISAPETDIDRKNQLLEAFKSSDIFNKLIERYNGQIIPKEDGIANVIQRDFGFQQKAHAAKASKLFIENCNYLGILDENSRLKAVASIYNSSEKDKQKPPAGKRKDEEEEQFNPPKGMSNHPILLTGNKMAYLSLPESSTITSKDIKSLKIMIDAIIDTLELKFQEENE